MGNRENWTNRKFGELNQWKIHISGFQSIDGNGISVLAIMKKLKNDHHFVNINHMEKFQITDTPSPPKDLVSSSLRVNGNGISVSAIMKNGHHFINIDCMGKFQIAEIPPPPKVWVSGFLSVKGNGISASATMKKLKNGCHFININLVENFQITNPLPQSLGL